MSSDVGLTYLGQTVIITTVDDDDDDVGLHVLGAYYRPKRGPFITLHSLLAEEWGGGWRSGAGGGLNLFGLRDGRAPAGEVAGIPA